MLLVNCNIAGYLIDSLNHVEQYCIKVDNAPHIMIYRCKTGAKLLIFKSKKIRLMGHVGSLPKFPFQVVLDRAMSMTAVVNLHKQINLYRFHAQNLTECFFEPEIFPAVRIKHERICINLFSTGKMVLLGIRSIDEANDIVSKVRHKLSKCVC